MTGDMSQQIHNMLQKPLTTSTRKGKMITTNNMSEQNYYSVIIYLFGEYLTNNNIIH